MPKASIKNRRTVATKLDVTRGSGNVFADLGLRDALALQVKADLVLGICEIIQHRKLSQTAAAKLLGIGQPKVSALVHGDLDGFSSDRLFRFLVALGQEIEIVIRPRASRAAPRPVRVTSTRRSA